jgi:purine catabolism regulator
MDITLSDLLILEPRISPAAVHGAQPTLDSADSITVSWAVTARTTPPHLPSLRGGEVLIVPPRVVGELDTGLSALLREAALRRASAIMMSAEDIRRLSQFDHRGEFLLLEWHGDLGGDTETLINRRLTESRGELYRVGSELERKLAELAVNRSGVGAFVRLASAATNIPISVLDSAGRVVASSLEDSSALQAEYADEDLLIRREIFGLGTVTLGPLRPDLRVTARFLQERIIAAAEAAMKHDEAARPRGPRRAEATEALLAGQRTSASEQRADALALGLDPDAVFFVAVSLGESDSALARALGPLGAVYPAGGTNGKRAILVAANRRTAVPSLAHRVAEIKRRWECDHAADGATLALSAPAFGVASLPAAAREAQFVASLQAQSAFPKRAVSFASVDDVGALRLLYHLRDTTELRHFVSEALGTLEYRDQRGTLRATLRAFLESGGSQVDASHRLGIHRNTLAYRLRRIGEIVGRDVADPGSWLTLHLALRASEMLELCTEDG